MRQAPSEKLLTSRGVAAFWLVFAACFVALHYLVLPGRALQDAIEAELLQGHLAGGYQLKNPPLYEWLLWTVQLVLGAGPLSYLVLRYGLIAATGILFYFALLRPVGDRRLAAAFSLSLVLFYWFGWESHHNVSHSLALSVAVLAFWLVALAYIDRQTVQRAIALGLVIGLGVMAKWSFILVAASFAFALGLSQAGRRVLGNRRSLLILAATALPILPFALWLAGIDPAIIALHSIRSGSPRGFMRSEMALLVSLPLLFLPWALIVLPLAFRFRREGTTQASTEFTATRLALLTAGIATAILALVIALVSLGAVRWLTATGFAIRYLYPFCLVATLGIAGLIARRIEPDGFARVLSLISVAASVVIFAVKLGSLLVMPASGDAVNLIPYTGLADALADRGLAEAQFVANSPRDAGNLVIYLPKARALALSARIEPPPPDPLPNRPCVLIWTDENHKVAAGERFLALLGVTKQAHATEDVTVDWGAPLIGTKRQSVWHILRGEAVEKACRRVAARGVL